MSKFKIEKVENRNMIECDKFLLVNYLPIQDKISHYAFIYEDSVQHAKSNLSVGQWRIKSLKNN